MTTDDVITLKERQQIIKALKKSAMDGDAAAAHVLLSHGDIARTRRAIRAGAPALVRS